MGKLMELAFSISGKLGSTFTGSTQKASQSLAQLKAEANWKRRSKRPSAHRSC